MRNSLILCFLLFLISKPAISAPLSCGDSLMANTILTENLHCDNSNEGAALIVAKDGITVDLNGYTISGNGQTGLIISERKNVTIRNGQIRGFGAAVGVTNSEEINIVNSLFSGSQTAIRSYQSSHLDIANNYFINNAVNSAVIQIHGGTYRPSYKNIVRNNEIYGGDAAIYIANENTFDNTILDNKIFSTESYAIYIFCSNDNLIKGNSIYDSSTGIQLGQSSYNLIEGNSVRNGNNAGLSIIGDHSTQECSVKNSNYNRAESNHFIGFPIGVNLGLSVPSATLDVAYNEVLMNKIYNNQIGIYFSENALKNNAEKNGYLGTVTPIGDDGVSNSY